MAARIFIIAENVLDADGKENNVTGISCSCPGLNFFVSSPITTFLLRSLDNTSFCFYHLCRGLCVILCVLISCLNFHRTVLENLISSNPNVFSKLFQFSS